MLGPFATSGAMRLEAAAAAQLDEIEAALEDQPCGRACVRLHGNAPLSGLLAAAGPIGSRILPLAGDHARPVRATLFDKNPDANWSLAWHQDRTICVRARRDVDGFGPWTVKSGLLHVAPPFDLLERMVTVRIHLDESLVGRAASSGTPVQVADLSEIELDPHLRLLFDAGWRSLVVIPLVRPDRIVGALVVRRLTTGAFSDETCGM